MDALVDSQLESYYMAATNHARRLVASRYALEECATTSPDYPKPYQNWREVWRVYVKKPEELQDFILAIPQTFPDHLPKAYLPTHTVEAIKQIPHLDTNRFLCTFDEVTAKPNADDPGKVALSVLERAITVFRDGMLGANREDYAEELQAYWALDSDTLALSLIESDTRLTSAAMLHLKPGWHGYSYLFALTEDAGKEWLRAVGCASKIEAQTIPYLHLQTLGDPPLPRTNGEIYRLLRQQDNSSLKCLMSYLQRSERPSAVLFSTPTNDGGRMIGAWWHPKAVHEINYGPRYNERHQRVVPGFRTGLNELAVVAELSVHYQQTKIGRASVERVDRARLFERTVGTSCPALEHKVNMVGCGSLGSIAVAFLAQSGAVDRFRIIDPETLRPENVQRHYCGMSDVGECKAEVTARKLSAHFPHVECELRTKDVLELLCSSPIALIPSSLTVVTIGDIAVERRLNTLFHTSSLLGDAPLCFMWAEPHLLAGHVLFLKHNRGGCFECAFDEHFRFRSRVLSNPESFSQREAGCQSTFVPYSGANAMEFVAAASRFIVRALEMHENTIFSWVGDVEEARARGIELESQWKQAPSFSTHTTVLTPNKTCLVCAAND